MSRGADVDRRLPQLRPAVGRSDRDVDELYDAPARADLWQRIDEVLSEADVAAAECFSAESAVKIAGWTDLAPQIEEVAARVASLREEAAAMAVLVNVDEAGLERQCLTVAARAAVLRRAAGEGLQERAQLRGYLDAS